MDRSGNKNNFISLKCIAADILYKISEISRQIFKESFPTVQVEDFRNPVCKADPNFMRKGEMIWKKKKQL